MHEFICPFCGIPLRIRDDSFRNRTIDCPDCHQPVLIQESENGLTGVRATVASTSPLAASRAEKRISPIWWLMAGTAAIFLVGIYFLTPHSPPAPIQVEPSSPPEVAPLPPPESVLAKPASQVIVPPAPTPRSPAEERLLKIGQLLAQEVREQTDFPNAAQTPGHSWIARLAESHLPPIQPHWGQGWDAPVNDEFVRRKFPEFDNPLIAAKTGDDGYPTTHFVGVSGVGSDAADLPSTHPRAGIFSTNRKTRSADVSDGLSNTMLVAGVETQLGSWARPGTATIRSFQREPYLHGPDGFGTGEADGMLVLMADGSVKRLSAQTDPAVVRQLAAMADGNPRDAQLAHDLNHNPQKMDAPANGPANSGMDAGDSPIAAELAPEIVAIDIQPRLRQKVATFEQTQPIAVKESLSDLQELIGVPFDLSAIPKDTLETPVALTVKEVTVEDILKQLCEKAGLVYSVQQNHIRISPQ